LPKGFGAISVHAPLNLSMLKKFWAAYNFFAPLYIRIYRKIFKWRRRGAPQIKNPAAQSGKRGIFRCFAF